MSTVRVLVGTRKGAFILTSNEKREQWEVSGPFFGGWEVYHLKASPVNPDRIYASQSSSWFGQVIQRSDDGGENWNLISGNLPTDFGFPIEVHAHEPNTVYVVPIKSDSEHFVDDGKLRVYRSRTGGTHWEALTNGLPQENCYVNVLRDAMSTDTLPSCGIYFGTSGGQVYCSPDSGDHWQAIVRDLPGVLSIEVQTLP